MCRYDKKKSQNNLTHLRLVVPGLPPQEDLYGERDVIVVGAVVLGLLPLLPPAAAGAKHLGGQEGGSRWKQRKAVFQLKDRGLVI